MRRIPNLPLALVIALTCLFAIATTAHASDSGSSDPAAPAPDQVTEIIETVDPPAPAPTDTTHVVEADSSTATAPQPAEIVETAESRATCDYPHIENPFTSVGDYLDYVLAPDGKFDDGGAGWQLTGGAKVVQTDKGRTLRLPNHATATSPAMCVDLNFPTFRMYHRVVREIAGLPGILRYLLPGDPDAARVKVEVIYHEVSNPVWSEMARFDGRFGVYVGNLWKLSDHIDLQPELGGSEPGARQAALRFTVLSAATNNSVLLDDIYVDPMRR